MCRCDATAKSGILDGPSLRALRPKPLCMQGCKVQCLSLRKKPRNKVQPKDTFPAQGSIKTVIAQK